MLGLSWRPRAIARLTNFIGYIADRDPAAAERLQASIYRSIEHAREFPEAYRIGRRRGTREIVAHRNYIVIYRIAGGQIDIVTIIHARQKYP
jgi:toxin ParE1/3/4